MMLCIKIFDFIPQGQAPLPNAGRARRRKFGMQTLNGFQNKKSAQIIPLLSDARRKRRGG
jgi:hypothetical protein